jgi:hypothetical protein
LIYRVGSEISLKLRVVFGVIRFCHSCKSISCRSTQCEGALLRISIVLIYFFCLIRVLGGKGQLVHKADNPTAICEPIVWRKYGSLDMSQPYGPSQPVAGIALPLPKGCLAVFLPCVVLNYFVLISRVLNACICVYTYIYIYIYICVCVCVHGRCGTRACVCKGIPVVVFFILRLRLVWEDSVVLKHIIVCVPQAQQIHYYKKTNTLFQFRSILHVKHL